jgi:hypothetical protein
VLVVLACLALPGTVAATSMKDVRIGIRVLDFVTSPATGRAAIGIVYDARSKESTDDAQAILDWLSPAEGASRPALSPMMVEVQKLDDVQALKAVIVASGMEGHYDQIVAYGRRTGTLIMSSDLGCVRAAKCTIGVASTPRVEVIVSFQEAQSSGIQFSEAFRMMVTEY